ncbi:aminotransferase [Autumnicola psychrophila]|uniref:Aminotransferase n=1 Tax=Autumnicola psychrophila TaxID=3075592 RepID=A0ABU3DQD2_9FLAO|nr:aminotransferase [Zunongwangia sp. F225]MDT0685925.1 aminotransferase [Zunongwangia sp. F225]
MTITICIEGIKNTFSTSPGTVKDIYMKIVSSSGKGNFKIIKNDQEVCELVYNNWFSDKAQTVLNRNNIEIKPKNIWTSKVDIFTNKKKIGDITFNLKGHMVIRLEKEDSKEYNYLLKNKAKWKLRFEVYNESEILQFSLNSVNKWNKLNYDYNVEVADYNSEFELEELLIYCGYAANLYLAIISAA